MMECTSKCTKKVRNFHSIGVNDLGIEECLECGSFFTKKAIENSLKIRFGSNWETELIKLKSLRREINSIGNRIRKRGISMIETVYFKSPHEDIEEHLDHIELSDDDLIDLTDINEPRIGHALIKKYGSHRNGKQS